MHQQLAGFEANQYVSDDYDIVIYIEALQRRIEGQTLDAVRVLHPFLVRTFQPSLTEAEGKRVLSLERMGKRSAKDFGKVLTQRNHTLKRALCDPTLFSGIGNAYSDEILFRAALSPLKLTQKLKTEEIRRLFEATVETLNEWTELLRQEVGEGFPAKVTAFRDEMFVHGRYKKPCRRCETSIQRIRYAQNETNYCPRCQNEGRLLADRSLSQLLKKDWPKTVEELENRKANGGKV